MLSNQNVYLAENFIIVETYKMSFPFKDKHTATILTYLYLNHFHTERYSISIDSLNNISMSPIDISMALSVEKTKMSRCYDYAQRN